MVTVPTYQRNVQDRPALQQGLTTRASGEDLGAGIGRGLQQLAQGVDVAAAAKQRLQDAEDGAAAKEADNALAEWSRNAMYGETGFMTLEGKAAVDGRSGFEKSFEDQRKALLKGLSPGAARLYDQASSARRQQVYQSSIVHTAEQRKTWIKQASASRVETFGQDALAGFSDPRKVDFNISAGQAELRQQAALEGWDADTLANNEMDFISGVRKAIVMRMAVDDPLAAKAYADRFSDQLTGTAQAEIAATLDTSIKEEQAKQVAADILGVGPNVDNSPTGRDERGERGSIEEQLAAVEDDDVRELAAVRIKAAIAADNSAREAAQKEAKTAAFEFIIQGGSPDALPLEVKSTIGIEGMASLWTYYEKQAGGDHNVTDQGVLYDLTYGAAVNPEEFAKLDLNEFRSLLSPADFKEQVQKQASIVGDARKAKADAAPIKSAFSMSNDALAGVGLSTVGLKDGELADTRQKIALFNNALAGQIEEFRDKEKRNPDEAEIQKLINRLLLPVVMKKDWKWGVFGGTDQRDGFLFEAGTRADEESVDIAVQYQDIPIDLREAIATDLEKELSRKPSPDEVSTRYEEFLLGR